MNTVALVILILVAIIVVLNIIALINAVRIKSECSGGKQYKPDEISSLKYAQDLSQMIKIESVRQRGNSDLTKIYEFHTLLEKLYPNIHNKLIKTDIDGALLFYWKSNNPKHAPVLLMSHMDVVEASGEWKHGAFDGNIADGKVWGRGTVDTKGALCAILESIEKLIADGFEPDFDIYIASSANEEITGDGAVKTVEYLYQKGIRPALVMDEGGAVMGGMLGEDVSSAMVGIIEKGRANVKFIAHSHGGHASVPFKHNPFARLARVIDTIERHPPFKKKITPPVREMYKAMAPYMSLKYRFFLGNMWLFEKILPHILGRMGGQANALVSSTCVFTQAEGSHGANVIPETASVTANMRFMLHEPLEATFKKVSKIAHKNDVWMEMISGYDICKPADTKTYAYKKVTEQIAETFGDIPIIPYVMLAGTDSRHYTKICDCVLRFVPLTFSDEQLKSAHAVNENINISSLARAVEFYVDFLKGYGKELKNN